MPARFKRDISEEVKAIILKQVQQGSSYRHISSVCGVSLGAVASVVKKKNETGVISSSRKNCGRKSKASMRDMRNLLLSVRRSPTKSTTRLRQELQGSGIEVCKTTIRTYLKKLGFKRFVASHKPLLTQRHRKLRLQFARRYLTKDENFWRHVLFTDETRIAIRNDTSRVHYRRKSSDKYRMVVPTVKHPASVMLWGCFAANGVGRIRFLETGESCNAAWYLKVLNQQVKWSVRMLFPDGVFCLQDDGAPCHRARLVKDFIAEEGWNVLDWPPQSPDLNPIENLWRILKQQVYTKHFSSVLELKARIIQVWHHVLQGELLEKLALSMRSRLLAVIQARGGNTKY